MSGRIVLKLLLGSVVVVTEFVTEDSIIDCKDKEFK